MTPGGGPRAELESCFAAAVAAVDAGAAVRRAIRADGPELAIAGRPLAPGARLRVLAVGKAAAAMAAALESLAGDRIAGGLAVTADGHGAPLSRVALREAGHPLPDARGERAAREALALVAEAPRDDVLVVLLSGGASALLPAPAPGLQLEDLVGATRALLRGGADIEETNAVRKHLSGVAGGRLAERAACERVVVLALSDVPGDRIDVIGSGPFAPDPTTYADALAAVDARGLRGELPERALRHLEAGARGERPETPKPGAPALARVETALVATNRTACDAAVSAAARAGLDASVLEEPLAGEAREAGAALAARALSFAPARTACLVAGGETAVTVRGHGRGGRSQELALAAALALDGGRRVALLAAGTDGTDGPTDAAGAYADGGTVSRGRAAGVDARSALDDNDAYGFFAREGGLLVTGPTRTNVMDLALLRVEPR